MSMPLRHAEPGLPEHAPTINSSVRGTLDPTGASAGPLFEQPGPAAIATERLHAEPAIRSVDVITGDFLNEALPRGHDVVLLAHVLHGMTPEQNVKILHRVREAVHAGAR